MAAKGEHAESVGIWIGGAVVIVGTATMIFGSLWIGLAATLVGLVALGGSARRQVVRRSRGDLHRQMTTGPGRAH